MTLLITVTSCEEHILEVIYAHQLICICGIYLIYEGHICSLHMQGRNVKFIFQLFVFWHMYVSHSLCVHALAYQNDVMSTLSLNSLL